MKAANMPVFNIWKRKNTHRYPFCLAKMTFNNSHLWHDKVPSKLPRGHFITRGQGQGHRGQLPSFPLWRRPCARLKFAASKCRNISADVENAGKPS